MLWKLTWLKRSACPPCRIDQLIVYHYSRCTTWIYAGSFIIQHILNNIFFFPKDANLGNYADDSTLYAYNKNLETVICNLSQEFSILFNWFYDNYMVLNPGKCHLMLFGVK